MGTQNVLRAKLTAITTALTPTGPNTPIHHYTDSLTILQQNNKWIHELWTLAHKHMDLLNAKGTTIYSRLAESHMLKVRIHS